ncbi:MAG TPA: FtsX-like permease family protein [Xanthobacteraceae bacterium]|nr:FtsX-like permease family protein [Xanthobacteraceae bacterium]
MTIVAPATPPSRFAIPLRFALRDLRGGLRGFYVFIACIALGVMAIAGVNSFASSLGDGLAREGRTILGGDVAFTLIHREADATERAFLDRAGRVSAAATMRAMARTTEGGTALVEIKAVDGAYPLFGAARLEPAMPLADALAERDGVYGAAAEALLLARLDLKPGARITVGNATIEIRATLASEPDRLSAGGFGLGPRLMISPEALRATGLLQPGSQVRWHYRLRLADNDASDAAVQRTITAASAQLPDAGWEVRGRSNASPGLERNIERFTQYLTLVGLTALLVGGVGVANAIRGHLDRKRDTIATLKSLGATGGSVFVVYLTQVMTLAFIGAIPGLIVGAALPYLIAWGFGSILPLPLAPTLHPEDLALALVYGLLTALAFAIWPLGRAHDVSVSALFRDEVAPERRWPRRTYVVLTVAAVALLATLAVKLAYDQRVAAIFVVAAAGVFVSLRLVASLVMAAAKRVPRPRSTALRLAIANIHRPGALTPSIVMSLGLGLALLVTVIEVDGNLRRQFIAALPEQAPSFFFLDIQSADAERFDAFIREHAPGATLERVPMMRGRIVSANNVRAEDIRVPASQNWVLQSDRGITYSDTIPAGSRVTEGTWWPRDYSGPPLVSLERRVAGALGLKIGDNIVVNISGRNIEARVANLRTLDWQSLGINFAMVFAPASLRAAPHTFIATLTYPGSGSTVAQETALLRAAADAFPAITTVRVREAVDSVGGLITNLVAALRGASGLTLLIAVLVLGGALAAGHRHRVYDAVVLKTVGATRGKLLAAYALEYLMLGVATAVFGVAAGTAAAAFVVSQVMNLPFTWLPGPDLTAAAGAILVTVALGLIGTFHALGQKPAPVLRSL